MSDEQTDDLTDVEPSTAPAPPGEPAPDETEPATAPAPPADSGPPVQGRRPAARALGAASNLVRRHRVLATVAAALVVVVVVVAVRAWTGHPDGPGWARSPERAVQGYLKAVADGRADDAIAYLFRPPDDRTFLTGEVLAESRRSAPLTDVSVSPATKKSGTTNVKVTYQLGGKAQTETFEVLEDHAYWFVAGAASVELKADRSQLPDLDFPVLVNGAAVTPGSRVVSLFPGQYTVTSGHSFVQLDDTFTVGAPKRYPGLTVETSPRLSDEGRGRIAEAAQAQLDSCLAQPTFATDCRFFRHEYWPAKAPTSPGTVSWSQLDAAPLPQPEAALSTGLSRVWVAVDVRVRCSWTDETGGPESLEPYGGLAYYLADATDPDHITVQFFHTYE